jgi:hypothetical protein
MLTDPLLFAANSGDANMTSYYATDFAPGSSTRVASITSPITSARRGTLKINHSTTRENAPVDTKRTLIRLDVDYVGDDGNGNPTLDKPRTASVYMVLVQPNDGFVTDANMSAMAKGFCASLFASGTEATFDTIKAALSSTYLDRLIAGEG